jgi:iron complex outermembrane receptor protein
MIKSNALASVAFFALAASIPAAASAEPAAAAADAAPADAGDAGATDEITVLGFGRSRQVQEVTNLDIARMVPGASPLKAIEKLPGVNYQAADPFGAYEWAVRISLRGFNQNQLGFTLDDVPLGDMSYGNVNGLHVSRAIISENVGRTTVSQGAGALATASTSNLGGTIQFYSRSTQGQDRHLGRRHLWCGRYGAGVRSARYGRHRRSGFKGYVSYA